MARGTIQVCSECGFQTAQWLGQCPGCEAWNTLVEERIPAARGAASRGGGGGGAVPLVVVAVPVHLAARVAPARPGAARGCNSRPAC